MLVIVKCNDYQIVIMIFEMMLGMCQDFIDVLNEVYVDFIFKQLGFIVVGLYVNDVQMCIVNYF